MKSIIRFLKKYALFIFLAALVASLIVLKVTQNPPATSSESEPAPAPPLSSPQIPGQPLPAKTELVFSMTDLPKNLPFFTGVSHSLSPEEATAIADQLGFSVSPITGNDIFIGDSLTWIEDDRYLLVGLDSSVVNFELDLDNYQPTQGGLPNPAAAQKSLESLLTRLDLFPNYPLAWQKEVYLKNDFYFQIVTRENEAHFIKVGFNPSLGDYQLVGLNPRESLVSATFGPNEELISLRFENRFTAYKENSTLPLEEPQKLPPLLSNARVVNYGSPNLNVDQPDLSEATLNEIRLAYFQENSRETAIQPIYILSGSGITLSGEIAQIDAYLPAFAGNNLETPREHFKVEPPVNPFGL